MSEHSSVWLAGVDQASYPGLDGDLVVDVAVVGGGIAGLTTALLVQRSGMRVAVIEAGRIGAGTTGHTTGKVTSQHTLIYRQLVQKHGEHRARLYADANQAAIEMIASLAEETEADCQFERAPAYVYTLSPDERGAIEAEHEAAIGLGLPAMLTTDVDLPFPVEVALRFDHQAHFHASRYTAALARSVAARGGRVFEHTRATRVVERSDHAIVQTAHGEVRAAQAVLTTLLPFVDLTGFFAKARASRAYGVAARLRGEAPTGMHINVESPTRSTRPWLEGNRPGLIVVGETHPTGDGEAVPGRWGELERWTRQHFDVESFDHRWSAQDYTTADHIPYVGRSPRMARTFVATGFNKWGLSNGTAAAVMLADLVAGHPNSWLEAFDATRIGDAQTIKRLIEENLHVAKRFLSDRLARRRVGSAVELEPGEGGMVKLRGDTVGAYRDSDGALHAVSITCTHMGCTLHWNAAETTWDCPCHGSRFSHEGDVLNGPAARPLERKDGVADQ